ncbi:MAG: heterodisulfide reductase-related iron-sulfur binding cluster [Bacillota bacterium]
MKEYALFLGCTVPVRAQAYEKSVRAVASRLGIVLTDIPELSCCGYPISSVWEQKGLALAARNLALSETAGFGQMVCLCSACSLHLKESAERLNHDSQLLEETNQQLARVGLAYRGTVSVFHIVDVLLSLDFHVKRDLSHLHVACHHGCHYFNPSRFIRIMELPLHRLVERTGARLVEYPMELECCGGGSMAVDERIPAALARAKLQDVYEHAADLLTVICPFCYIVYGASQKKLGLPFSVPVYFYPQLLGLAMGIDASELGLSPAQAKTLLSQGGMLA